MDIARTAAIVLSSAVIVMSVSALVALIAGRLIAESTRRPTPTPPRRSYWQVDMAKRQEQLSDAWEFQQILEATRRREDETRSRHPSHQDPDR